jgi:hypothetical protein
MNQGRRATLAAGLMLILFGAFFLIVQFVPGLTRWLDPDLWWPLLIVGIGAFFLLMALLVNAPPLAVPACIVGGIGLLLFWQNATGNWDSWAYAWALIPGFVGAGLILTGLLSGKFRQTLGAGVTLLFISAILFGIFGALLGGPRILRTFWPILLIALGVLMLVRGLLHLGSQKS